MAKRVGLVIGHLTAGGAERQLYEIARHMDRSRYEPIVYCLSQFSDPYGPLLEEAGIAVRVYERRRGLEWRRARALARDLRADGVRIVDSFLRDANAYAFAAWKMSGARALIASVRLIARQNGFLRDAFDGYVLRHASLALGNSETVRRYIVDHYRVPPERTVAVYNGVSLDRFEHLPSPEAVKAGLGIHPALPVVMTAGRLAEQKNHRLLIDAASRVLKEHSDVVFLIAGEGPLREALAARIGELGLGGGVRLLGIRSDIPVLLSCASVFALTSDYEGFPNAVLEAMAAGLPSVVTKTCSCGDLIESGTHGLIVPPRDADALGDALLRLLRDPQERERMGTCARERVRERFSMRQVVSVRMGVYDRLYGRD